MTRYYTVNDRTTGEIQAEGVIFANGKAVTAWPSPDAAIQVYDSEAIMRHVHQDLGHRDVRFEGDGKE